MATIASILRDGEDPSMPALRAYLATQEGQVTAALLSNGTGLKPYMTKAALDGDTDEAVGQLAYVYANNGSPADAANTVYQWSGSAWVKADWYYGGLAGIVQPIVDQATAAATAARAAGPLSVLALDSASYITVDMAANTLTSVGSQLYLDNGADYTTIAPQTVTLSGGGILTFYASPSTGALGFSSTNTSAGDSVPAGTAPIAYYANGELTVIAATGDSAVWRVKRPDGSLTQPLISKAKKYGPPIVAGDGQILLNLTPGEIDGDDVPGTIVANGTLFVRTGDGYIGIAPQTVAVPFPTGLVSLHVNRVTGALGTTSSVGGRPDTPDDCVQLAVVWDGVAYFGSTARGKIIVILPDGRAAPAASATEAIAGSQPSTLAQLRGSTALTTGRGYMSRVGQNLQAFGDSITFGYNADQTASSFIAVMARAVGLNYPPQNNHGIAGGKAADISQEVFNKANYSSSDNVVCTLGVGTNDIYGAALYSPSDLQRATFKLCHAASLFWLATRSEDRVDGGSLTKPANWTNDTTFAKVTGAKSSTNGALITYPITTNGGPIYVWSIIENSNAATFNIVVRQGATVLSTTPVVALPPAAITSAIGYANRGVAVTRIIVPSAGAYSVDIVVTSSSGTVSVLSVGTVADHVYYNAPSLVVMPVPMFKADQAQLQTAALTMDVLDNIRLAQRDGLDVRFSDDRTTLLDPRLMSDDVHPTTAGHAAKAVSLIDAVQRVPAPSVKRGTPPSSAGPGTPGDTWAAGDFVYGVRPDRSIRRAAISTW